MEKSLPLTNKSHFFTDGVRTFGFGRLATLEVIHEVRSFDFRLRVGITAIEAQQKMQVSWSFYINC